VTHVWIEGAGHGLKKADATVAEAVVAFLTSLATPPAPVRAPRRRQG